MRKLQWMVVGVVLAAFTAILVGLFFGLHAVVRWIGVGLLRHIFHVQALGKGSDAAWWAISVVVVILAIVFVNVLTGPKEVMSGEGRGLPPVLSDHFERPDARTWEAGRATWSGAKSAESGDKAFQAGYESASSREKPGPAKGEGGQKFIARARPPEKPVGEEGSEEFRVLHEPPPMPKAPLPPLPADIEAPSSAPGAPPPPPQVSTGEFRQPSQLSAYKLPPEVARAEPATPPPEPVWVDEGAGAQESAPIEPASATAEPVEAAEPTVEAEPPEPSWKMEVEVPFTVGPPFTLFGGREEAPAAAEPIAVEGALEVESGERVSAAETGEGGAESPAAGPRPAPEGIAPAGVGPWLLDLGPLPSPKAAPEGSAPGPEIAETESRESQAALDAAAEAEWAEIELARRKAEMERAKARRIHKLDRVGRRAEEEPWGNGSPDGEQARLEPAQYVNFKLLDATVSEERLLGSYEGLYAGLKYRLVVSMAMEADVRFAAAAGPQPKVERPPVETVILDVVLALEENLEILGERWSTLEWPQSGPSMKNAEFFLRPGVEGKANLKVLMYYQHDLVFSSAIKFAVGSEGDDWPVDERPITWTALDEARTGRLSLFLNFQDLDREARRGLNISVHRRAPELFDLVFFLRGGGPVARAYPLRVEISEQEIGGYLAKTRSALRLLTKAIEQAGSDGYSVEKFVDDMSLMGNELWARLFRGANGTRLAAMIEQELTRPGDIIQIWIDQSALDFVFPWPWLYPQTVVPGKHQDTDARQFWGYRYVVEQLRQLNEEKRPASTVMGEPLRIAGALHNFTTAEAERKFFADYVTKYSARLAWAEVKAAEWRQFLPKSDAHLLYFYCHGHTEQPLDAVGAEMFRTLEGLGKTSPAQAAAWIESLNAEMRRKIRGQSGIAIEREILNMADLAQFQSGDPSLKPVVFLNMCESSEFYPGATDNMVDMFLRRGARGVIGTEVPVLAAFGDAFARGFFEAFFAAGKTGEGNEIGMVLWQLRRKFLDEGNPLAFIYTYFGDATTRLKPAIIDSPVSVGMDA